MASSDKEDGFFGMGCFDGIMDDIEAVENAEAQKVADKLNFECMMEHIGGFEYWPMLIGDCKEAIAKFLDPKTLTKLGKCSKADHDLVDKVPIHIHRMEIVDNNNFQYSFADGSFENVTVGVEFDKDYKEKFELVFSQLGEDTQVQFMKYRRRYQPEVRKVLLKKRNYYEEAVKFAEKWMERCQFGMEKMKVEMCKYPIENSKIKLLPECSDVRIGAEDVDSFQWWLEKLPEKLERIQFLTMNDQRDTLVLSSDFLSQKKIMDADDIYFWCRTAFTDKQFLNLKASRISFDAVNVTDDGINELLKKWVNGNVHKGFKQVVLQRQNTDQSVVTRGLELRPWDEDFENEAGGFCYSFDRCFGRGEAYQIYSRVEPRESLTLSFHRNSVAVYATGKIYIWKGNEYTGYGLP